MALSFIISFNKLLQVYSIFLCASHYPEVVKNINSCSPAQMSLFASPDTSTPVHPGPAALCP